MSSDKVYMDAALLEEQDKEKALVPSTPVATVTEPEKEAAEEEEA